MGVLGAQDAGGVDEYVEPAEGADRGGHALLDGVLVGYVEERGGEPPASPSAAARSAVAFNPASSTSTVWTRPPSARMRWTVAWPMPEPPPVMRTRRPS